MTESEARFQTYAEFWPYYLREHSHPWTRRVHVVGTTLVVATAIALGVTGHFAWILATPVIGYAFAWYAHFFIEKNRPATFKYPWWSFLSDFKMTLYWYLRKL